MTPTTVLPNVSPRPSPADLPTQVLPCEPAARLVATPAPVGPLGPIPAPPVVAPFPPSGCDWDSGWGEDDPADHRGPRVGDVVHGFALERELGRGAFARVFLARQQALAGRPVAVKITLRPTTEGDRLARLQHANIVPVYSVHGDGPGQLICMPFLGRTTIADLIREHRTERSARSAGRRTTVARASQTALGEGHSAPGGGTAPAPAWGADGPPDLVGDPRAVFRVLARLAAGLAHAHARGVLHRDIKPANVLLSDTGEPMLLDFNLAADADRPELAESGGTLPYMSVEQLTRMRDPQAPPPDARADLYSLGAMAFEMLTGRLPFAPAPRGKGAVEAEIAARRAGPPSARALNPLVSPAEDAVVRTLLAPHPDDRYQTADDLRTDLERHLSDLPLRHARGGSPGERFAKWRRRNPGLAPKVAVGLLVGLVLALGAVARHQTDAADRAAAADRARDTRAALEAARLDLILPCDPAARARGLAAADRALAAYGLPENPDWRARADVRRLAPAAQAALAGDLGELLVLTAEARAVAAESRPESERGAHVERARELNRLARRCFPEGAVPPAVERQAARLAAEPDAGGADDADGPRALFLDGAFALQRGQYATAAGLFEEAVAAEPNHGAAQFGLAYCLTRQSQLPRALERYEMARALLPRDPRPALHRGTVFGLLRKPAQAEKEFTRAIELDPSGAEAYQNRGLARYRLAKDDEGKPGRAEAVRRRLREADADLTAALERGASELSVRCLRAAVRDGFDADGAAADREAARTLAPVTEHDRLTRGRVRLENNDLAGALADFEAAERLNPHSLAALRNQAHIWADKRNDTKSALAVADRMVERHSECYSARAGRAVLLARAGRRDDAHADIARAQELSDGPEVTYAAARVYALTSAGHPGDRAEALRLFRKALKDGFTDPRTAATESDLRPLCEEPEFQEIRRAALILQQ